MPSPLLEAAYLLQAFICAIEVLQVSPLFFMGWTPYSPSWYYYMYLSFPPSSINPTNLP
jgi:hypothetical protein